MKLKQIIKDAVIISEDANFTEALDMMLSEKTNTILVVDGGGKLSGEVSVSDLFDGIIPINFDGDEALAHLKNEEEFKRSVQNAQDTPVFDFMSSDFTSVHPDVSILEIASIAVANQRARIPVVDHEERPIGIISRQGLKQILGDYMHAPKA